MLPKDDPANEGHTREWQDRARVVIDAKKAAHTEASPNQSPVSGTTENEDVEEKSDKLKGDQGNEDRFY